ncbi:MAG TPA: NAD-dependent epimerase/dehydratase family protein, partial [Candidatus Saccharimonadales bacterium]|nr:NAD-dependent epimerase/dehydratase family protein [Candidatus Saccharimonadales bacterium]
MKVIVTGSSGFVGSHLGRLLREQGCEVIGIGHLPPRDSDPHYHKLDLLDSEAVGRIDFGGVDVVIHLAGLAAVGPSFEQPRRYIDANAGMQINLFEAMIKQGVTARALIISTGNVYRADRLPITEDAAITTPSPYAVSKMAQEYLTYYYGNRGFEVMIARPFNHIGPGQTEGFIVADLAKQIAEAERQNHTEISVGNLASCRDYTDVRDIVRAYWALINDGKPGEIYNVCSGVSTSGERILKGLLKNSSVDLKIVPDPAKMRPS